MDKPSLQAIAQSKNTEDDVETSTWNAGRARKVILDTRIRVHEAFLHFACGNVVGNCIYDRQDCTLECEASHVLCAHSCWSSDFI